MDAAWHETAATDVTAVRWCLWGALCVAYPNLHQRLAVADGVCAITGCKSLTEWNDVNSRTQQEVINVLQTIENKAA